MSLTEAQALARQRGIGASEVAALLGCSPFATALDVWATKARGKDGEVPPLTSWQPDPEAPSAFAPVVTSEPTLAGSIMEDGIVRLYEVRTDSRCRRSPMRRHREHSWATCSPDRIVMPPGVDRFDRGLECKLVGQFSADAWPNDSMPEHVWIQVQWSMGVTGRDRWDVAALVGGTDFRVMRMERDDAFIADAMMVVRDWWHRHIIHNEPPSATDAEDLKRHVRRQHPLDNGEELNILAPENAARRDEFEALLTVFLNAQQRAKEATEASEDAKAALELFTGNYRSVVSPRGRFNFASYRGNVAWKRVAEHLAGGIVADNIADQYRGDDYRKSQFYPRKGKAK